MPRAQSLLACFAFLAAGCSETFEKHYADRREAEKDGAVVRGWLPDWLPSSATDIREIHNLDTNKSAFSFSIQRGWSPPEAAGCVQALSAAAPSVRFRQFPSHIEQRAGVLKCGDLFVLVMDETVVAWR
jgi:hypothetical protein